MDLSHYWRYSQDGAWAKSLDTRCVHSWVLSVWNPFHRNWGPWNLILAVPMHSRGRTGSHLKRSNFLITPDQGFRHRWRRIRWHLEFSESQMQQKQPPKKYISSICVKYGCTMLFYTDYTCVNIFRGTWKMLYQVSLVACGFVPLQKNPFLVAWSMAVKLWGFWKAISNLDRQSASSDTNQHHIGITTFAQALQLWRYMFSTMAISIWWSTSHQV